ncbi:MAG: terpene cyclase/mutase family protein, partial [Planctomycetales bacterium]
ESEKAVRLGLEWLKNHQQEDGRWGLHKSKEQPKFDGYGSVKSDTAATGLALLPFLGAGHTHVSGDYQDTVTRGVDWLVANQKENGDLYTGGGGNSHMYSHGIAAIALCEAYGVSQDRKYKEAAQRAIDFIIEAQHKGSGGWRYKPGQSADTSVVGWQLMALKSAEMAGLNVPKEPLSLVTKWFDKCEGNGKERGTYGYQGRGGTPAMTAEGLLCRQFLGMSRDDDSMRNGAKYLLDHLPKKGKGKDTSYYWYYATQVMYHMQGDYWEQWNASTRDMLVKTQPKNGDNAGTWDPKDQWEKSGGRIFSTSLRLLMLEVYYRHLPLYRQLED